MFLTLLERRDTSMEAVIFGAGKIVGYIRNGLQEDIMRDQISLEEYIDLFTGNKSTRA